MITIDSHLCISNYLFSLLAELKSGQGNYEQIPSHDFYHLVEKEAMEQENFNLNIDANLKNNEKQKKRRTKLRAKENK